MKYLVYLLLLPLITAAIACSSKKEHTEKTSILATMDSTDAQGVQRMQVSNAEMDITFKGKEYHSAVLRTPSESLPYVDNGIGDTYLDNTIMLRLTCGSETVVNKTFTKNDFADMVDAEFLSRAVLEGIVYDKVTPQGIVYAASIGSPQTDLYVPLSITVTADGKMNIVKVNMFEE